VKKLNNEFTPLEVVEMQTIRSSNRDSVLIQPDGADKEFLVRKTQMRGLSCMLAAEGILTSSTGSVVWTRAHRNPGSVVDFITLRFFADQDQGAKENRV
jgi:hypothetical protein